MNKLMLSALAFFVFAAVAQAQDIPAADLAGGYSFLKVVKGASLTAEGGSGSVALTLNSWLGAVSDFALYHSSLIGPGLAAGTYTFGPRFSYRHWGRITPFTQVLFGGVRYANNGFVFATGGGADFGLDHAGRFALRPQVEYFGFHANGATTNTVRLSVGIVFRMGKKSA
jgi:hypothetical protein